MATFAAINFSDKLLMRVYDRFTAARAEAKKSFAVLIDPDKANEASLNNMVALAEDAAIDYFLVGGSLVISNYLDECVKTIKSISKIPVVLFPGSPTQITPAADALLYLSLISGRNPELLIGQHVVSAPFIKSSGLEVIPTGYMVIDGGAPTTVSYISNSSPLPADKADIAMCTAMAGQMLGMKLIYMDAGSGARNAIQEGMINMVASNIEIPLIVGGGITSPERAYNSCKAGADVIVVGNALEKDPLLIKEMSSAIHGSKVLK